MEHPRGPSAAEHGYYDLGTYGRPVSTPSP